MKIAEVVSQRTRELLLEKGITQYRLEKDMAIPHNTMTTIMTAKNKSVNLKTVMQIARGLGITASEFLDDPRFNDEEVDID